VRPFIALAVALALVAGARDVEPEAPPIELFLQAASRDDSEAQRALDRIATVWRDDYAALIVDLARLFRSEPRGPAAGEEIALPDDESGAASGRVLPSFGATAERVPPGARIRARLTRFLERQTKQRFGGDLWAWREWIWSRRYTPHPEYFAFKGAVYAQLDPRMAEFFRPGGQAIVRLDEVDWGGVGVNGIPPLDHPAVIGAADATYLKDNHVVFGIVVEGAARAYPKRILAWHELARDRLGGVGLTVVYCTLCGTVIPYESEVGGARRTFGTSGLLYRSNKLMFDEESRSLWSTLEGTPVIGALAGSDLRLRAHGVVTTTWGEWRTSHPETTVLSLETGHRRDYAEGAAYRDYFATDRLMFRVSKTDRRLKNKAEVLVLQATGEDGVRRPLALAADFLKDHPVYLLDIAGRGLVVLTTPKGANRVYDAGVERFARWNGVDTVEDGEGRPWRVTEHALLAVTDHSKRPRPRIPAHRAFWFAWYAQFPETLLIR
jgi:hypothetical protein